MLHGFFTSLLEKQRVLRKDLYRFTLTTLIAGFSCFIHIVYAVFFMIAGAWQLCVSHSVGVAVFVLAVWLFRKEHYDSGNVLVASMILVSSLVTVYFIGGDNYSLLYQLLTLSIFLLVPFRHHSIQVISCIIILVVMVTTTIYDANITPPYDIGTYNDILRVSNVIVNAVSIIILVFLVSFLRRFVDRYQQLHIQELKTQAQLDPLTGLKNRRFAEDYIRQLRRADTVESMCVAMADIDDFKQVNDRYGHDTGDQCLKQIALVMLANVRRTDQVIRWGGEEFLILMNNITLDNATRQMEKIRELVAGLTLFHADGSFRVTITIGVAPFSCYDSESSIDNSDKCLYTGKRSGKNRVVAYAPLPEK